jgi:hypothetical protein
MSKEMNDWMFKEMYEKTRIVEDVKAKLVTGIYRKLAVCASVHYF